MPEAWARTTNVNLAAALSTLGIPLKVDQTTEAKSGTHWRTLLVGLESVPGRPIGLIPEGGAVAPQEPVRTRLVMDLLQTGRLERDTPDHPLLDALAGLHNEECLKEWIRLGTRHRVAPATGTARWLLVPGEEPQSVKECPVCFRTSDIRVAASLCRLGVPIARIEGPEEAPKFVMPNLGYGSGEWPPINAHQTVVDYRAGTLPADHPFHWPHQALVNKAEILRFMGDQTQMILLRKPGSGLGAIIPENATDACLDKVRRHYRTV